VAPKKKQKDRVFTRCQDVFGKVPENSIRVRVKVPSPADFRQIGISRDVEMKVEKYAASCFQNAQQGEDLFDLIGRDIRQHYRKMDTSIATDWIETGKLVVDADVLPVSFIKFVVYKIFALFPTEVENPGQVAIFVRVKAGVEQVKAAIVDLGVGVVADLTSPKTLWLGTLLKFKDRTDFKRDKLAEERDEAVEESIRSRTRIESRQTVEAALHVQIGKLAMCLDHTQSHILSPVCRT
jgi:hypothetical protein